MRWPTARTRKTEPGSPARSQVANQLEGDGPDPPAGLQALGTRGGGRRRYLPLGPQALSSQRAQPRTRRVSIKSKIWCAVARRLRRWATTSLETPTFTVHLAYVLSQHDDLSTDMPHLFAGTERQSRHTCPDSLGRSRSVSAGQARPAHVLYCGRFAAPCGITGSRNRPQRRYYLIREALPITEDVDLRMGLGLHKDPGVSRPPGLRDESGIRHRGHES